MKNKFNAQIKKQNKKEGANAQEKILGHDSQGLWFERRLSPFLFGGDVMTNRGRFGFPIRQHSNLEIIGWYTKKMLTAIGLILMFVAFIFLMCAM